jgi:hypothetical protein
VAFGDRLRRAWHTAGGKPHADGSGELHVGDARFDDWDVVQDFAELKTARAFCQTLAERGVEAVLTADWALDEFGRGDIALRVPPGQGIDVEEMLDAE